MIYNKRKSKSNWFDNFETKYILNQNIIYTLIKWVVGDCNTSVKGVGVVGDCNTSVKGVGGGR